MTMARATRERQLEAPGLEKPQPEGVDDDLVHEVHRLTTERMELQRQENEARAKLLDQLAASGAEDYETHDGYKVTLRRGKSKVSVKGPPEN